ncbi:hypothetical protein J6Z48_00635 [bacterium]|nr:hypothetical protein [bacterium]
MLPVKEIKEFVISVAPIFFILSFACVVSVGLFAYSINNEKQLANEKVLSLDEQISDLSRASDRQKEMIKDLEESVKDMENTIQELENKGEELKKKGDELESTITRLSRRDFSDEDVKMTLQNYLDLLTAISVYRYVEWLGFENYRNDDAECRKGDIDSLGLSVLHGTNIPYTEVFARLRDYMSEEFVWEFISGGNSRYSLHYSVGNDGYFCYSSGSGVGTHLYFTVASVAVEDNHSGLYVADVVNVYGLDSSDVFKVEFRVEDHNGRCVISYIKSDYEF